MLRFEGPRIAAPFAGCVRDYFYDVVVWGRRRRERIRACHSRLNSDNRLLLWDPDRARVVTGYGVNRRRAYITCATTAKAYANLPAQHTLNFGIHEMHKILPMSKKNTATATAQ